MMGADSVEYHEHAVAGRSDDPVVAAAAYYASRGETPMSWGGSGRGLLGLDGEVDLADYRALFGTGGAHHPVTGERLVACRRPGLELVVSPPLCRYRHKATYAESGIMPNRALNSFRAQDPRRGLLGIITGPRGRPGAGPMVGSGQGRSPVAPPVPTPVP